MKLWDIAKKVGGTLLKDAIPGVGMAMDVFNAVNQALPPDKQLNPDTATGNDLAAVVPGLPKEVQEKELDVQITLITEQGQTLRAALNADINNPQSTRPKIAYQAFQVVAFCVLVIVSAWAYSVFSDLPAMTKAVTDGWPFVLAVIGPFIGWLNSYFGILRKEHAQRMAAANGNPLQGALSALVSAFKK